MKICYFTATGNSLYVAKRIGGDILSIPKLMRGQKTKLTDEAVGIVCPVYAGEMPGMVRSFLDKSSIKADYVFFIYTYGMSETVARPNAVAAAKKAGLRIDYVNAVKMVDNYLPGFEAQQQMDSVGEKDIEGQIDRICNDISSRKKNISDISIFQKIGMAAIHNTMGRALLKGTAAQSYIVTDSCIRCGICAKVCPADNIVVADKVIFSNRCEVCYACLHNCPKNALHLKNERSTVRFRNEHIKLGDILASNEA